MKLITKTNGIVLLLILFNLTSRSQIGGAFSVPVDFPTIAAAINTLNLLGVAAPVTINVSAGHTETAIPGGYKLYQVPGASATNSVLFVKSGVGANPIAYAYTGGTATPASAIQDGVWSFMGADYITVDGIDIIDQNLTATATMEYGFGFFKVGSGNGCQYNTIRNCSISLNKNNSDPGFNYSYAGCKGIFLSCGSSTLQTTMQTLTATAGSHSYNRFYSNTITNCQIGINLMGYSAGAYSDLNNQVGGNTIGTGNTIFNFGGGTGIVSPAIAISTYKQYGLLVGHNIITNNNGSGADHTTTLSGIETLDADDASFAIVGNTITLSGSAPGSALLRGIYNEAGGNSTTNTVTISRNVFPSYTYTNSGNYHHQIICSDAPGCRRLKVDSNSVKNVAIGGGTLSVISVISPKELFIRNDSISGVTGTGNRFNGIIYTSAQSNTKIYNNLVENVSWLNPSGYLIYGITGNATQPIDIQSNTVRNFLYSSNGSVWGISENSTSSGIYKYVEYNVVGNFDNLPGSSGPTNVTGIRLVNASGTNQYINSNTIYSLNVTSTVPGISGLMFGIDYSGGHASIYKNKISGLSTNYSGDVMGINLSGSSTQNYAIYNNLIGNIGFPNSHAANISGLSITNGSCSVYYNTILVNAAPNAQPNFNSTVIRHFSSGWVRLINNILVNTSTPNGTGKACVIWRNFTSLTNYSVTSNNNLMYAGVPSASNVMYDDGTNVYSTLASFKTAMSPREAASVTENPPFLTTVATATNFLALDPLLPTQAEGLAQVISGYPTDYAGTTRNTSTPDMGAWEGNYTQADIAPPAVVSSGFLGGDCSATGRTFTLQATDVTGVSSGSLVPRLFYRVNLGLYTSTQGVLTSGTATNGTWSFNMVYSANTNDVIRYFFTLQDASALSNYSVFPSTGSTSSDVNNVLIAPPAPYTFTVMPAVNVTVNSGVLCIGSSFTLTPSGAVTYTFSSGSAIVNPTSDATYTVTGTGVPGCVTSSVAIASVSVVPLPTITVNSGTTCSNQTFTLSPSGTTSYSYQGGSSLVNPVNSTSYSVVGIDANGCVSAPVISSVTVFAAPPLSVNVSTICEGVTTTVTASGANTYTWSANAGGGTSAQSVINPTVATVFTVSGSNANCVASYPFTVDINPIPVISLSASGPTLSCSSLVLTVNTNTGNTWTQKASFPTSGRSYGIAFSIGTKGYVGTGYNTGLSPSRLADFWEYNSVTNTWTQKANFAGGVRSHAVAFAIGSKGYVGTGTNGSANQMSDFWEYNPVTNTWLQKANFGGGPWTAAAAMSVGNKGYVGTGYSGNQSADVSDFWEYDPATDTWTQKTSFPGLPREQAAAFGIGNKGYMGTGNVSSTYASDFYEYDPATNAWSAKASYGAGGAIGVVGFSMGYRGYFSTGSVNSIQSGATWEYNPLADSWTQRVGFANGGVARINASGFAIGTKAYIVFGVTLGSHATDLWQYDAISTIQWSDASTIKTFTPPSSGIYSVAVTNVYNCQATATQSVGIQTYPSVIVTSSGGILCGGGITTLSASGASSYTWSANAGSSNASSVVVTPSATTSYTVSGANAWCVTNVNIYQEVITAPTQSIVAAGPTTVCGGVVTLSTAATNGNTWLQRTNMPTARNSAVAFSIGNKGYVGTGATSSAAYTQDFWEYDPATNVWTQKANFGGVTRYGAVGFAIGNRGYIGTGYSGTYRSDMWEYNPVSNTWVQKANFPGGARRYAAAFVVNGKAYVGTGNPSTFSAYNDLWEYNPASDTWVQKTSLSIGLGQAVAFGLGNKGYICTGADANLVTQNSLYEYDPVTNAWATKATMLSARIGASAFAIGTRGYVTTGSIGSDFWEYDQATNVWTAKTTFPGTGRYNGVGFAVGNKGYIGTGGSGYLSDLWEYDLGYAINWSTGATVPSITATTTGVYTLTLSDTRGCATTFTQNVNITPSLTLTVSGPTATCLNSSVTLTAGGAGSYTWSANAGGATTSTVSVSPAANIVYTVQGSLSTCTASTTRSLTVNSLPTVTASVSNPTVCNGQTITLTGSGASSYAWTGGVTNALPFAPATGATHTVTGTDANNCSNTATVSFTVSPSPTVSVSGGSICAGSSFTFSPTGGVSYTYSGNSATVSPLSTSVYTVTGFGANGCPNATLVTATVTVNAVPTITINSGGICPGKTFTFVPGGANSYTITGNSNTVSPAITTTYAVSGTGANGCVSTTSAISTVTVFSLPSVTANVSSPVVCNGQTLSLFGSGASTYTWTGSVTNAVPFTPASGATHTVTGFDINSCTNTATVSYTVNPSPTVSVNGGTICAGTGFTLNPSGGVTYTYSGGSATVNPLSTAVYTVTGFSANGCPNATLVTATVVVKAVPSVTANSGGICPGNTFTIVPTGASSYTISGNSTVVNPAVTTTYAIAGTGTNGCISPSYISTVTVHSLPTVSISGASSMCPGATQILTATGANTYTWIPAGVNNTLMISPAGSATYIVTGTDANGCTNTAQKTVTLDVLPTLSISGNSTVCEGKPTVLQANGTAITFTWSTGANGNIVSVSPTVSTVFTTTGTAVNGCTNTATMLVFVNSSPILFINPANPSVCQGGSVALSGSGASTYTWTGGITDNVAFYPSSTSIYTLTGTGSNNCVGAETVQVVVNPLPTVVINSPDTLCDGETITLTAGGANVYSWGTGETTPFITVTPTVSAVYVLTGTDVNNCTATVSRTLEVMDCTGLEELTGGYGIGIYPNPSTGLFRIYTDHPGVGLNVEVYTQLSQLLYITELENGVSELDLRDYANGIYFIKVLHKGKPVKQQKIVKAE